MGCGNSTVKTTENDFAKTYCYTQEEKEKIELITKEKKDLKDNKILFKKVQTQIDKKGITVKEFITVCLIKGKYPYTGKYEFISNCIGRYIDVTILDVKYDNNIVNSDSYQYNREDETFTLIIPFTLNKSAYSFVTFEVSYNYLYFYCFSIAPIEFELEIETNFFFTINVQSGRLVNTIGNLSGNNQYNESDNNIVLKGNEAQSKFTFIYIINPINFLLFPTSVKDSFYYFQDDVLVDILMGINLCKLQMNRINVVSIFDEYTIYEKRVSVKSNITYFVPRYHTVDSYLDFSITLEKLPGLKVNGLYLYNQEQEKIKDESDNNIKISMNLEPNIYFCTVRIEYSFPLTFSDKDYYAVTIKDRNLLENCFYQLMVIMFSETKTCSFYRKDIQCLEKPNNRNYDMYAYIIQTPYKKYDDQYAYNYMYIHDT